MTELSAPPAWVRDAVFYQIFPDRFAGSERVAKPGPLEPWYAPPTHHGYKGGDLLGIVERLDYLAELGITALYLNPIFASASNHRYHTFDFYRVDPLLGGDEALRELLDACHARGMRVVLDGVFNHASRGFWPFHHVAESGLASPYLDWIFVDRQRLADGGSLVLYPSAAERREIDRLKEGGMPAGQASVQVLGYEAWWDLPALPKLNTDNPQMREHLLGAAEHWLRFGIDGWRLDVAEEIDAGFWREFRQRVRAVNPDAYIVAEIWRAKPQWCTGDTFDALMNYPLTEAIISFVAAREMDREVVATQHEYREFVSPTDGRGFAERLEKVLGTFRPETNEVQLNLLGSHDTARFLTVAGGDVASLRLALLAIMTLPGAPCIYYGDEIGMSGRHDPDCRRTFPWDESNWDHDLLGFVKGVVALRHQQPVLRHGGYRTLAAEGDAVAYARDGDGSAAIVLLNAGRGESTISIELGPLAGGSVEPVPLPGHPAPHVELFRADGRAAISLAGRAGAVLLAHH
ncbi:MAG TPA: glycoside hydrolase family 13 protein [Candidatus Limnocylindrales bacterium]|nr:glycoside hydrolase family 13 protein [Candidatus Limnocylindrales bacterium]